MSSAPLRSEPVAEHPVYAVAGGNHVTLLLPREQTDGALDVIDVLAQPGGGPPPHRHEFGEFFRAMEGELTMAEERDGVVVCTQVLRAGDAVWVPPGAVHATLNLSDRVARFQVIGQPGLMTGYFVEAGVRVPDPLTSPAREPPGPDQLRAISARWGIEFWTGPVDLSPPSVSGS